MGYKLNGVDSEGLPIHLVNMFTQYIDVNYFVETGTAGGESIKMASQYFAHCHTIELIEGRVIDKYLQNVTYHTGDSVEVLPGILPFLQGWALFFLDAHYSDSVPNTSGYSECPVLAELSVISKYKSAIIIIDDARLFFGPPPAPNDPRQWPRLEQIFAHCRSLFPDHHTTIIDDFIVCYHDHIGLCVEEEWRSRFNIRYPSAADKLKSDAKSVYNALKTYLDV